MPITKITLENFKGISERTEVELKPITILFGANSAGKSTLLQAMLYLREILSHQNADADKLQASGTSIDLGGFRQIVHQHDLSRNIRLGVSLELGDDGLDVLPVPEFDAFLNERTRDMATNGISGIKTVSIDVEVSWNEQALLPQVISYEVSIDGILFGKILRVSDHSGMLTYCDSSHPALLKEFGGISDDGELPSECSILQEFLDNENAHHISDACQYEILIPHDVIPDFYSPLLSSFDECGDSKMLMSKEFPDPTHLTDSSFEGTKAIEDEMTRTNYGLTQLILSNLIVGSGKAVLSELEKTRYIGPLRTVPDRNFNALRSPQENRWADGIAAWDKLYKSAHQDDKNGLIKKVSSYISSEDKLDLGYEMKFSRVFEVESNGYALNALRMLATTAEDEEVEVRLRHVIKEIQESPQQAKILLRDLRKQSLVSPNDIGIGVSQVIPVIVSAMARDASITTIEQPELHLHPAVQARLGDLFLESSLTGNNRYIVESHSEHLMLRILRRIRECHGDESDYPEDLPQIEPESVAVYFISNREECVEITSLKITPDGDFYNRWPGGFFAEREQELF